MQQLSGNVPTTVTPPRSSGTGPGAEAITSTVIGLDPINLSGEGSARAEEAREVGNA